MQIEIRPDQEWIVRAALADGRYATAEDFVAELLETVDTGSEHGYTDEELIAMAEKARARGGYRELGPNWKEEIKAEATRLPRAG